MSSGFNGNAFASLALPPRGCPRWLWFLASTRPLVLLSVLSGQDSAPKVKWRRSIEILVPPEGAEVEVSYITHNWPGAANQAVFVAYPGDRVEYRARWWPWQKARLAIERASDR